LLRGAVEVTACGEFLGRLENDLFGEICVLDLLERRTANIIAATQCHCMMLSRQVAIPVLAKYPDARMRLLEHARQRLVALNTAIGDKLGAVGGSGNSVLGHQRLEGCAVGFGSALESTDAHLFAASPIFQAARIDLLHELSSRLTTKKFEEGKTIFEEDEVFRPERDFVYWIAKGEVEMWKCGHFVTLLSEGDVFGDISFSKRQAREASMKSKTKVILRAVKGTALKELLRSNEDPELMKKWETSMIKRQSQLSQKQELIGQMRQQPTHFDFMFMKLPQVLPDGTRVPKNEPIGETMQAGELWEGERGLEQDDFSKRYTQLIVPT